jgi:hypothetical protein
VASRAARSGSDFHTANRFLTALDSRLDELGSELRYEVESEMAFVRWLDPLRRQAMLRRARELEDQAPTRGAAGANVLITLAFDAMHAGSAGADRAAELAVRAAELTQALEVPAMGVLPAAATVLLALDRIEPARAHLDHAIANAQRRGSLMQLGEAATFRAMLHYRVGRLGDAEADARLADRICPGRRRPQRAPLDRGLLASLPGRAWRAR